MGRFGIPDQSYVPAKEDIGGMEITVKKFTYVQGEEFTMKPSSNAYVQMGNSGMDMLVWCSQNVAAEKGGTKRLFNVSVPQVLTGMDNFVFNV